MKTKSEKAKEYYLRNRDKALARAKSWAQANPGKRKLIRDKWRANNIEKARQITAKSRKKHKAKKAAFAIKHRNSNPGLYAFYCAKRRSVKKKATPKWLTPENLLEIKAEYALAAELSWLSEDPLEVDHIVPLQGKNVSGLHVPWNLQILPSRVNERKGNKHDSD